MTKLRETLDDTQSAVETATKFKTELNKHELRCGVCNDLFYVDDSTYNRVRVALDFDPTNNPFSCEDCEQEYAEEAAG
ncbi:MAG: hypothetical protein WAU45_23115 [Blastocatellia bacterium]